MPFQVSCLELRLPALAIILASTPAIAQSANVVTVNIGSANQSGYRAGSIPSDFLGISLEMSTIEARSPLNNNSQWLSATSTPLINAFKRIGIKSIRIGGNSVERIIKSDATGGDPTTTDAHGVIDFAGATGANLLWTLPVKNKLGLAYDDASSSPPLLSQYASFAKDMSSYAAANQFKSLTFLIGNEPDIVLDQAKPDCHGNLPTADQNNALASYSVYAQRLAAYVTNFSALGIPETVSGPSAAKTSTLFSTNFANGPGQGTATIAKSRVGFATGHTYPLGGSGKFNDPTDPSTYSTDAQKQLFLQSNDQTYQSFYNTWPTVAVTNALKPRIDETNSQYYQCGTPQPLEHEYAGALWVADYLSYLAYKTNIAGVNLHNAGTGSTSSPTATGYNVFAPMDIGSNTAVNVGAIGYGMFAFAYGSGGTPLAATLTNTSSMNATAFGSLSVYALNESQGRGVTVHLLNKSLDTDISASIPLSGYAHAQVMYLMQASGDVTASDGISMGGFSFDANGNWNASGANPWKPSVSPSNGVFTVTVPKTQIAIIHFYN